MAESNWASRQMAAVLRTGPLLRVDKQHFGLGPVTNRTRNRPDQSPDP